MFHNTAQAFNVDDKNYYYYYYNYYYYPNSKTFGKVAMSPRDLVVFSSNSIFR